MKEDRRYISIFCVIKENLKTSGAYNNIFHVHGSAYGLEFNQYSCTQLDLPLDWGFSSGLLPMFSRSPWTNSYPSHVLFTVDCRGSRSKPDYTSTLKSLFLSRLLKFLSQSRSQGHAQHQWDRKIYSPYSRERYCKVTWQKSGVYNSLNWKEVKHWEQ